MGAISVRHMSEAPKRTDPKEQKSAVNDEAMKLLLLKEVRELKNQKQPEAPVVRLPRILPKCLLMMKQMQDMMAKMSEGVVQYPTGPR